MSNAIELLRRALDALIAQDETICAEFCCTEIWDSPPIIEEIRAYLATELEAYPVAWIKKNGFRFIADIEPDDEKETPLYLHPPRPEPTSKPLTSNERLQGFIELRDKDNGAHLLSFLGGVCFAEKHHKIGDEE